jgi:hypothetical protein
MKKTLKEMKKMVDIANIFSNFIKGRSFGFSENLNSTDANIVRYNEGLQKISTITGISTEDLEQKSEIYIDDDLVDVKFIFNNVAFEYSFIDKNTNMEMK